MSDAAQALARIQWKWMYFATSAKRDNTSLLRDQVHKTMKESGAK
jgi:DUF1365 family protein